MSTYEIPIIEMLARDAQCAPTWFTGPASSTAMAMRDRRALLAEVERLQHAFKNFHRALCERFGYCHDEKYWWRDQISLIEWIAKRTAVEATSDDWRPVTDGLPLYTEDRSLFVEVYSETHDWGGTQHAIMRQMDFYAQRDDDDIGTDDSKVATHWRPLRAPGKSTETAAALVAKRTAVKTPAPPGYWRCKCGEAHSNKLTRCPGEPADDAPARDEFETPDEYRRRLALLGYL